MDKNTVSRFLKLRVEFIKKEFSAMNDRQLEAVLTVKGPLLLLAGAGSGKTTVLINRIANIVKYGDACESTEVPAYITENDVKLLESALNGESPDFQRAQELCALHPCAPWQILAITFTNKAANELKNRLCAKLGDKADDIWAMTFHSACVRILRRDITRLGYNSDFTIYDSKDSESIIKHILKDFNLDEKNNPPRSILLEISKAKGDMVSAEKYCEKADILNDIRKKVIGRIYYEYEVRLKAANAVDFDDLLLLTVILFKENEDVLDYYRRKFRYVLIDEYQDTNHLQYLFASYIAGGHNNICVVGDDDQSIYKFRGATIENILNFEDEYKNTKLIRLEQNYRSTGHILGAANSVIVQNKNRKGKNLWTEKGDGEKIIHYTAADENDEAKYIANHILEGLNSGLKYTDFAVLYRMNAQSNRIETALKGSGIAYRVVGGMKFYDRAEIKDILAYLSVIANHNDDLRLLRIINVPARGIGGSTVDILTRYAAENSVSVFEAAEQISASGVLSKAATTKLSLFTEMINSLSESISDTPMDVLFDEIVEHSGYVKALEEKRGDEALSKIENIGELKTNILQYMEETPEGTLIDFLNFISLYTDLDAEETPQGAVSLMTMHSAKGLEFHTVFIAGAEDAIFPGSRAIGSEEDEEEERRLCYVAITRAKVKLHIISARKRMLFGKTQSSCVSRFVTEIAPEHLVEKAAALTTTYGIERESYFASGERSGSYKSSNPYTAYINGYGSRPTQKKKPSTSSSVANPSSGAKKTVSFSVGDKVRHKAFGSGVIKSVKAVGNDALLEIDFEKVGTKKLMKNTASAFMDKD